MRRMMLTAAAMMALAACDPSSGRGPALPTLQEGAQAPSTQTPPTGAVEQVPLSGENRRAVESNILDLLNQIGAATAQGASLPAGFKDNIVTLQPGTDHRFVINLTGGTMYSFIGACDADCNNVDIELIDMSTGGVIGSDMLDDDYPVVHYRAPADGEYMVRLLMQNCTRAPCYTAARVLAHPRT